MPPAWTYLPLATVPPRTRPARANTLFEVLVVVGVVVGGYLLFLFALDPFFPPGCPGMGLVADACPPRGPVSVLTLTAQTVGNCTAGGTLENSYRVGIGGATQTATTSMFGLALTQASAATATAPGNAGVSSHGTCYASPASGGWFVVLIPPGGSGSNWAIFSGSGWQQCTGSPTAPCTALSPLTNPVTIVGGQTFLVVGSPSVTLTQAQLAVYGTNGNTVTGSVTL